jgi:type IV pilus assembly protein PilB
VDKIGKLLVEAGLVEEDAVRQAHKMAESGTGNVGANLVTIGAISDAEYTRFLSSYYNVPAVDLSEIEITSELIQLVPADVVSRFQVVPVKRQGRRLTIATSNPSDIFMLDDVKFITGCEVSAVVASEVSIKRTIDKYYDNADSLKEVIQGFEEDLEIVEQSEEEGPEPLAGFEGAEEAPVVKFVNTLLADAVKRGASDIHIEPYERTLRVRFRIDGELYEMMSPPFRLRSAIISRIKIMADLDIAERRRPQDGRIKIRLLGRTIDLRVSACPTIFGEKIVMRILDKSNLALDLTKLGFQTSALERFQKAIQAPYGIVLVTGPTGSGKTTTLYSALSRISKPNTNVMTVEDPVEYNIDGINQVNVNEEVGLTFAAALRSFLRQDPNIIMVGEIRDLETASIAVKAALTGHLVLSTIHTNDAPSTLNRLVDMGVEPFLVGSSVNLIQAQRLVRKVCTRCAKPLTLSQEEMEALGLTAADLEGATLRRGSGCYECSNTGYRGRIGIYETMPVSPRLRELILSRANATEIKRLAMEEGMLSLRADALLKLKTGITTPEEVLKESMADER